VNPDLLVRGEDGKVMTVRYHAVNAMLLNEFLKEHQKVEELEASRREQQNEIKTLAETVKEQASEIQKVSAQLELSKPTPQTATNQ
jgi:septal ring factor EnvC (AmiA/AmiB activator)